MEWIGENRKEIIMSGPNFGIRGSLGILGAFCVLCAMVIGCFVVGAWLWPYAINTWLVYTNKPPYIEWWMGGLMGLVPGLGQSCIPAAFVTFILMLFL